MGLLKELDLQMRSKGKFQDVPRKDSPDTNPNNSVR